MQRPTTTLAALLLCLVGAGAPAEVLDVHSHRELSQLLARHDEVIVYFTVQGCLPCERASRILERNAAGSGGLCVARVDIEETDIGRHYGVAVAPALVVVVDGHAAGPAYYVTNMRKLETDLLAFGSR